MTRLLFVPLFIACSFLVTAQLQTPDEFFDHKRGEHFTYHHDIVSYFKHVAESSPLVSIVEYGKTNQGRPLIVAIITSEKNHSQLDAIRINNLRLAGVDKQTSEASLSKAIVWLSHSVHGNESAGTESAPNTLYALIDPSNASAKQWLENTVVIIDPCINPDGFSRYVNWVRQISREHLITNSDDIEHNEPWPGGRVNHYMFDLNRDWAWQTQVESRQRLKLYHQWLPHVHADLHEMGSESPYYFAPAARPYHQFITKWQRDFQHTIGKNHAKYFDQNDWLYFTKEVFDLFYPSYGDTYPTYAGAIGMTYEQGGSGRAGRGLKTQNGEVLSLKDRIDHHTTAALSTVEVSSLNAKSLIDNFVQFYNDNRTKTKSQYQNYVIKGDKSGHRLTALMGFLDLQKIEYGTVANKVNVTGYHYSQHQNGSLIIESGDLVIPALQSQGMLTQILFDPESTLEDSMTYDITAWALPYVYGLEAIATSQKITTMVPKAVTAKKQGPIAKAYAYLIEWSDVESAKALAGLQKNNINVRVSSKEFELNGEKYDRGTLIVTQADNRSRVDDLAKAIGTALQNIDINVIPVSTGFVDKGPDLGSGRMNLLPLQKVLLVGGEGVSNLEFGQVTWYFDKVLSYPITVIDRERLSSIDMASYTTLILPSGYYRLSADQRKSISYWVSKGGKVIAMGRATNSFVDTDEFSLKTYATDTEKTETKKANEAADLAARYNHYADQERESLSDDVPGAIFRLSVDSSHPLGYGLGASYHSLRTGTTNYPLMVNGANVIYHPKDKSVHVGFAGSRIKEKLKDTVVFGVENIGRGSVVYMADNPLFRGFWYNGIFLFSNALFLVE